MKQHNNKSKRYYSRISKKKYKTQKGGAAAAAAAPIGIALEGTEELMPFKTDTETFFARAVGLLKSLGYDNDNENPSLLGLVNKIFTKPDGTHPMFHIDGSMSGPLIDMQNNPGFMTTEPPTPETSYLAWYKQYNPDFLPIRDLPPEKLQFTVEINEKQVPIFETLIAQICRDACFMILTGKKNIDNQYKTRNIRNKKKQKLSARLKYLPQSTLSKTQQLSIIKKLDDELKKHAMYDNMDSKGENISTLESNISSKREDLKKLLQICNKCVKENNYLDVLGMLFEYMFIFATSDKSLASIETFKQKSLELPYIFYPTYTQVSYKSVVLLCTAPIVNFRLVNRQREVHGFSTNIVGEYEHDVEFHAKYTHGFDTQISNYQVRFNLFNIFIKLFYPQFDKETKNGKIYAFILFALLHENHSSLKTLLSFTILDEIQTNKILEDLLYSAKDNKFFEFMKLEGEIDQDYFLTYLKVIFSIINENKKTIEPLLKYLI